MPAYSPECPYGWSRQIAEQIILYWAIENNDQDVWARAGPCNYQEMLATKIDILADAVSIPWTLA